MNQKIKEKTFSRDYFDRQDPADGAGNIIIPFSFSSIYDEVDKDNNLGEICDELYNKVYQKLQEGQLGENIDVQIIDFQDAKQKTKEKPRRYLQITRETNRKTRITILARFLPYGNKLFVAVDSYVLGSMNWAKIFGLSLLTLLPFSCYPLVITPSIISEVINSFNYFGSYSNGSTFGSSVLLFFQHTCCCIFPWIFFAFIFIWLNTYRNFRQENNLKLSLRQSFNQILNFRSFNIDDIFMTLKSVLPLILSSIREVFTKYNLPVKSIDDFSANIQNINTIQNIYGSGNAVTGSGGNASINNKK